MGDDLTWSCGEPSKPGETYEQHLTTCSVMGDDLELQHLFAIMREASYLPRGSEARNRIEDAASLRIRELDVLAGRRNG